ncbi:ATP-dependent RNA helicase YTHDC2 [Mytilus galloprovincialis]|uniref:ATP-dependent RNA helicase YTHDC2 n=2 Tax=Mytilus galloprovincialis TaxID=29158 RepID=A0A8B6G5C1_MYTGA|nr:ATP-dependent RNA helicase YTHDC2 [Mytilus galloprovincialis]
MDSSKGTGPYLQRIMQRQNSSSPRPSSCSSGDSFRGPKLKQEICIGEEVKISVHLAVERFKLNDTQKVLEFPSSLTATERAYVHRLCQGMGFHTKSSGKRSSRYLTVYKKEGSLATQSAASLHMVRNSRQQIHSLLQRFPLTSKERQDLLPKTERISVNEVTKELNKTTIGKLNNGVAQIPPERGSSDLDTFRETLPVFKFKTEIMEAMNSNQAILVSGETGSGKTTQVPQMILDYCQEENKVCRIFCTQPRRIAALSIAERVAAERGEKIGQTVGYQIRLESKVSPKTLLTFCTNGVLLRTLMGSTESMSEVTHIILDEIHERDRFSDFLLIAVRDLLEKYPGLKVVLMSAALNIDLFVKYMNGCPVVSVPGSLFEVKEYYLEDVLKWSGYTNKVMNKLKKEKDQVEKQNEELKQWCSQICADEEDLEDDNDDSVIHSNTDNITELGEEKENLEPGVINELDQLLSEAWLTGKEDVFSQIFHLILSENVSLDYQHSHTSITPLMIAAGRGFTSVVEQLLNLGANINVKASNDWTALYLAQKFKHEDICELLEANMDVPVMGPGGDNNLDSNVMSPEDKDLLSRYHHSFDDELVDADLILGLLIKILCTSQTGAVLIFLPGYDDIVKIRDLIYEDRFFENYKYVMYVLHSAMQSTDQKKVFNTPPTGVRKIILATNIAETSITINDVVFVIDSGKVKEKTFDALLNVSMLKSNWISKASSIQRRGRAGRCRPGSCYHLMSTVRFNSLIDYPAPEILRYPLQELCLHTKLLAPANISIADFLGKAPEPPPFLVTRNAVHILKQMDALDSFEDLTELGHHLADMPIEPRLGKMVLYAVVLKCLDPILTIVCSLAYKDPFMLPAQPSQKRAATMSRHKFSASTYSDHMSLLRAFQAWQKAKTDGWDRSFCHKNYLSSAVMEMIVGMRAQLLGQLRASGFVRARGGGDIRDLNTNSENWAVVKASLCAGMYPNIIRVDRQKSQLLSYKEGKVKFHMSSVLNTLPNSGCLNKNATHKNIVRNLPSDYLMYDEMSRYERLAFVRCSTLVSSATVALFAGPSKLSPDAIKDADTEYRHYDDYVDAASDSEEEVDGEVSKTSLHLDDWLRFKIDPETATCIMQLRTKWHSLFLRRMRNPSKPWSQVDEAVIRAVINVLTNEEQALGLQQPAGIGQRPRPMTSESLMSGSYSGNENEEYGNGRNMRKGLTTPPAKQIQLLSRTPKGDRESFSSNTSSSNSPRGSEASTPSGSPQPKQGQGHPCRYYVMKCTHQKTLDTSVSNGTWFVTATSAKKINKAFQDGKTVLMIFSINASGHFQGYAKMTSLAAKDKMSGVQNSNFNYICSIEWIKRNNLPFQLTHHLLNPLNENKRVQISRDGQEVEPSVGEALTKLWDRKEPLERGWRDNQSYQHYDSNEQRYQPFNQYQSGNQYYPPEGASGNAEMFNAARLYGSMNTFPTYPGYMMSPPRQNPVTILQRNQNRRYQNYGRQHGPSGDN